MIRLTEKTVLKSPHSSQKHDLIDFRRYEYKLQQTTTVLLKSAWVKNILKIRRWDFECAWTCVCTKCTNAAHTNSFHSFHGYPQSIQPFKRPDIQELIEALIQLLSLLRSRIMKSFLVIGIILVQGSLGQISEIGCFVEGECLFSSFIEAGSTNSASECLSYCQVNLGIRIIFICQSREMAHN